MKLEAFGPAWKFSASGNRSNAWCLLDTRRGEEILNIAWCKLNNISEVDALNEKCRFHGKLDNCEVQIETENIYPFGGESTIGRTFKLRDKLLEVCVDVKPGRGECVRNFELEELTVPGEVAKLEIIRKLPENNTPWQLEELDCTQDVIYESQQPWAAVLLTMEDGFQLEVGIGGDYWRMQGAGNTLWSIRRTGNGIALNCKTVALADDETPERRPWRFNYYAAWGRASALKMQASSSDTIAEPKIGSELECGCFRAPQVRKALRKIVRKEQENSGNLLLKVPDVTACKDAGHLERPGKKELLHWSLDELFALYSWGNRQLGDGRTLTIEMPENSIFRKMPSGRYLINPPGESSIREL